MYIRFHDNINRQKKNNCGNKKSGKVHLRQLLVS